MTKYQARPDAVTALVRDTEVHKDLYIEPELFELEMEHLFAKGWLYVGHASQVPNKGDYYTTTVGTQPVVMVRHTDNGVKVLYNRCPHKGTKVAGEVCGNTGKFFRCPYHAWTFKTDGSLLSVPLKKGYDNTGFESCEASQGMAVELFAPFVNSYEFFENMGIRVWDNGHGHTGVADSIHAAYSPVPGYFEQMAAAYGEARAKQILGEVRHNTIYFPNIMVKGPIQTLRRFLPLAADKTLVESWTFRLVGAPDLLLERTLMYNRLVNAPTSVVGHDDLEVYERAQEGLHSRGRDWINVGRLYDPAERGQVNVATNGTSEWQMRNQFRAWAKYMTASMQEEHA